MGEIAEMMLDGTLCECCGCYIEGDGDGFPRYCSDECARARGALPETTPKNDKPFFVVKNEGSFKALKRFLKGIDYTYFSDTDPDKRGNPMFRLYYDKYPNKDHPWGVEKRGIVVCVNHKITAEVRELVTKHQR